MLAQSQTTADKTQGVDALATKNRHTQQTMYIASNVHVDTVEPGI